MANALFLVIQNCGRCKQFEAKCQIPEMEPILCTQPMELVHVDYVGMEVTVATQEKPVVKNVLVIVDHFTQIHPGLCYKEPHGPYHGPSPVQQFLFRLQVSPEADVETREPSSPET